MGCGEGEREEDGWAEAVIMVLSYWLSYSYFT